MNRPFDYELTLHSSTPRTSWHRWLAKFYAGPFLEYMSEVIELSVECNSKIKPGIKCHILGEEIFRLSCQKNKAC